jgi:hypothetical protein
MKIMARIIDKFGVKTAVVAVNEYKGANIAFLDLGGVRYKFRISEPIHKDERSPKFWLECQRFEKTDL